jgi:alpha-1,6-mannosyltransferase
VLERRAAGLGHATFLPFTHDRAEFAAVLASADLLLHGALCETFGFVIAEALASGTPVVGPAAGGAGALLHHDYAEPYEPRASAVEVARAVQRLLQRPRAELSSAALRAADAFPSSEQHFRHLFDFYARLLRERRTREVW